MVTIVTFELPTSYVVNFASKIFPTSLFKCSNQFPVGGTRAIVLLPFLQSSSPEDRLYIISISYHSFHKEMKKNGKKYKT